MASIPGKLSLSIGLNTKPLGKDLLVAQNQLKGFDGSLQSISSKMGTTFTKAQQPVRGTMYAVTNLNRVLSDMPYGLIGVANNLEPMIQSFQHLQRQTGSTTKALKALIVGAFTGPGALLTLVSAVPAAFIIYDKFFKDTGKAAKDAAKDISEFTSEFDDLINRTISDQGVKGIEAQEKRVKALNELWLEQTPVQKRLRSQIEGIDQAIKLMNNSTKGLTEEQNRVLLGLVDQKAEYERQIELSQKLKDALVNDISDAESKLLAMKMAQSSEAIKALKAEQTKTEELRAQFQLYQSIQKASLSPEALGNAAGSAQSSTPKTKAKIATDAASLVDQSLVDSLQMMPTTTQRAADAIQSLSEGEMNFLQTQLQATQVMIQGVGDNMINTFVNNVDGVKDFGKAFKAMGDVVKNTVKAMAAEFIKLAALSAFRAFLGGVGFAPGFLANAFQGSNSVSPFTRVLGGRAAKQPPVNANLFIDGMQVQTATNFTNYKSNQLGF